MPTAVRDLELTSMPREIVGLDHYAACLLLFRQHGRPVGATTVDVVQGHITPPRLRAAQAQACPTFDRLPPALDAVQHGGVGLSIEASGATVAVCTRDRIDHLRRCISALLQLPDDGQELLVIDSAPTSG